MTKLYVIDNGEGDIYLILANNEETARALASKQSEMHQTFVQKCIDIKPNTLHKI